MWPLMAPITTRKWLILMLTFPFGLALCSWMYHQAGIYFGWHNEKRTSPILRAWLWTRSFLQNSTSSSPPQNPPPPPTDARQLPQIGPVPTDNTLNASTVNLTESSSFSNRRISGSPRIVVLSTRQILLSEGEGDQITWLTDAIDSLTLWHAKRRGLDLYLITQCHEDGSEKVVRELFKQANIPGLNLDKVLFCSTNAGLQHMARQLTPDLFIDSSVDNLLAAEKWTKNCVLLGSDFSQTYPSLNDLVKNL